MSKLSEMAVKVWDDIKSKCVSSQMSTGDTVQITRAEIGKMRISPKKSHGFTCSCGGKRTSASTASHPPKCCAESGTAALQDTSETAQTATGSSANKSWTSWEEVQIRQLRATVYILENKLRDTVAMNGSLMSIIEDFISEVNFICKDVDNGKVR